MPFPLPDGGPPYSEDLRWFLVAVPDDAAFVRAALGAYTEFTKYWVWGKEGKEPGRNEAAQVWENAVAATLEALEMGFPDILLGYIDQVEQLLQELIDKPCCADAPPNVVNQPTPSMVPTDILDGVGSPPPTYGGDLVADWSDWDQRKCGMAEVLKVLPANLLEELLTILEQENQPGWIEYIGDLMGKIPGVGEIAKIIWDTFTQLLSWGINQFTGADEAIALIRAGEEDIKCAMYNADGEEAAAEAMKQATIDALGEYGHATIRIGLNYFPWELWAHVLYTGQFEDADGNLVNVPYTPSTDCLCETDVLDGWTITDIGAIGSTNMVITQVNARTFNYSFTTGNPNTESRENGRLGFNIRFDSCATVAPPAGNLRVRVRMTGTAIRNTTNLGAPGYDHSAKQTFTNSCGSGIYTAAASPVGVTWNSSQGNPTGTDIDRILDFTVAMGGDDYHKSGNVDVNFDAYYSLVDINLELLSVVREDT